MDWLAEGKVALGNCDGNDRSKTHGKARITSHTAARDGGGTRGHAAWSITITESWRWHSSSQWK